MPTGGGRSVGVNQKITDKILKQHHFLAVEDLQEEEVY